MSLEVIEQRVRRYLAQSENPIVPLHVLYRYVQEDESCQPMEEREFSDFMAHHKEFLFINSSAPMNPEMAGQLESFGFSTGPRVLLRARTPSQEQVTGMLKEQLDNMVAALQSTLADAEHKGNAELSDQVLQLLARAEQMQKMMANISI